MCVVRCAVGLFLAGTFFVSSAYRKKSAGLKVSEDEESNESVASHDLATIAPLLGQCPKDAKTNRDINGAYCDKSKDIKCCNHRCRYRSQAGFNSMRKIPADVAEKLLEMGEHPSSACCREAVTLDMDGTWTCRATLPMRDILDQIPRGPMIHRWHNFALALVQLYEIGVKDLEDTFSSELFYHKGTYTAGEAKAKPMVMTLGGYSTGKTTFIKTLLGKEYRGSHIGAEPTTDRYTVIEFGKNEEATPGEIVAVDPEQTFGGLKKFGNGFLRNFGSAKVDSPILQDFSILDTPGVLSGSKQLNRDYDFLKVSRWFADQADIILIMFDVNKIDISDELKRVINVLGPNQYKVRLVLNKADSLSLQDFVRSYGGLLFGLGRVFDTPELKRIYVGSFKEGKYKPISENLHPLFKTDQELLMSDLRHLSGEALMQKLNKFIQRVKLAKAHATLLDYLKSQLPMWGKTKEWSDLVSDLPNIYKKIDGTNGITSGDLPDVKRMQADLAKFDFRTIPKLKSKLIQDADMVLSEMATLMAKTKRAFVTAERM